MRNAFVRAITTLARQNDRVIVVSADTGLLAFDSYREEFPDRFINVGIAEANMIGMAAGMAMEGYFPFCFALSPFATFRCIEQIRIDCCYQNLPVRVVGVGGGFVYGPHGPTHQAIEDLGVLRPIPNITLLAPADPAETEEAVKASLNLSGPAYIRLGRNRDPIVYQTGNEYPSFDIGKLRLLHNGSDILIIAQGVVVHEALQAAILLEKENISVRLLDCHTLKPFDNDGFLAAARKCKCVLTVEEHNLIGGLGSACAEASVDAQLSRPFRRLGVPDCFPDVYGTHEELLHRYGLNSKGIYAAAIKLCKEIKNG